MLDTWTLIGGGPADYEESCEPGTAPTACEPQYVFERGARCSSIVTFGTLDPTDAKDYLGRGVSRTVLSRISAFSTFSCGGGRAVGLWFYNI